MGIEQFQTKKIVFGLLIVSSLLLTGASCSSDKQEYMTDDELQSVINRVEQKRDTPQVTRSPETGDKDCADFSTHAEAQAFFESAGFDDPHGLDRDGDGIACETLL